MTLVPGAVLSDRYVIHQEIGRGGYSVVYRAEDTHVGSDVAIKLLVPPPAVAQVARERMRREVQAARGLVHDNIVSVYDYIEDDEACYIVMEYIAGPDLARHVREAGPLDVEETAELGRQVADALTAAHRSGVLHRDVKPQNILIDPLGMARLADFGSARLDGQTSMTHTGGFVGTLSYLAPEVIRGERPDARADVYALGLTMYYALTGDLPGLRASQLPPEPCEEGFRPGVDSDVPHWLEQVVARATSSKASRRFATAAAMTDALVRRGEESEASPSLEPARTCLLCGGADPLRLAVCLRCGGADGTGPTTLLFLDRHADRKAKNRVADLLARSLRHGSLPWVLRGSQALVRLPRQAADRVTERMEGEGVPLRSVRQSLAWAPMPLSYYAMVGGVAGAGLLAGVVAPILSSLALPAATLLLLAGQLRLQRPVIRAAPVGPRLPAGAAAEVVDTLRSLPEGVARELMVELIFAGSQLYRRWNNEDREAVERLSQLLRASCAAVRELADLDDYLRPLESSAGQVAAPANRRWAGIEDIRDELVQRLLEVVAAIDALRRQNAALAMERTALPGLTDALERRARLEDEAMLELEAYLSGAQDTAA